MELLEENMLMDKRWKYRKLETRYVLADDSNHVDYTAVIRHVGIISARSDWNFEGIPKYPQRFDFRTTCMLRTYLVTDASLLECARECRFFSV